jgi:hypothetical protein
VFPDFLSHIGEAATSPLAFVGYVVVILSWTFLAWKRMHSLSAVRKVLGQYESDDARNEALGKLLGNAPPKGMHRKDLFAWSKQQTTHQTKVLITISYLLTLLALVGVFALAKYRSDLSDERRPPVLVDSEVQR